MPHRAIGRTIKFLVVTLLKRLRRVIIYRVLHVDDTPHRIALSLAIAFFVTWTPTFGLQMILAVALATLFKANKFVGVPFVWISNPFTVVPIYGPNYWIGSLILGGRYKFSHFLDAVREASGNGDGPVDRVAAWWQAVWPILPPLWIGSLIMATVVGIVVYFVSLFGIQAYRKKRAEIAALLAERRAIRKAAKEAAKRRLAKESPGEETSEAS